MSDDISFECPRCGQTATARFYGPCTSCAEELGSKFQADAKDVTAPEYEPKINVTPNAIATKD